MPEAEPRTLPRQWLVVIALLATAFLVRVGVRVAFGEDYFWANSYFFYYARAENILSGKGFCFGTTCAWKPPLYPLFLAATALGGKNYLLIIIPQAAMGCGTALCAFLIGRHIFNVPTGILACGMTAFYPYYVMHDTALQETSMVTFCMALSVWLLLRAGRLGRNRDWFLAGLVLGASALVRASAAPVAAVALVWTAIWGAQGDRADRLRQVSILLLVLVSAGAVARPELSSYRSSGPELGHRVSPLGGKQRGDFFALSRGKHRSIQGRGHFETGSG